MGLNRRVVAFGRAVAVLFASVFVLPALADVKSADGVWTLLADHSANTKAEVPWIRPIKGQALHASVPMLTAILGNAPLENSPAAAKPLILELPDPTGKLQKFSVVESPIMEPGLAAQFPTFKTYLGQGIDDPAATLRADIVPQGFHAQVLSPDGDWYIDPYSKLLAEHYTSYFKRDLARTGDWSCGTADEQVFTTRGLPNPPPVGTQLRTFRLANACTGEYAAFHGGTVPLAQAAIVTAINRVTGVYERDLSVRLTLVASNTNVVYTNAATDPYTNTNGAAMLGENQTRLDTAPPTGIGSANYDIGHVFSTGGGGIAGLGVVCVGGNKARGVTGSPSPIGDPFTIDYVAHEMGHQFGANHTFNSSTSSCGGGNRSASHAYEIGSGSTIMAYAGICGADDLQPNSDAYFAWDSFEAISTFVGSGSGSTCDVATATGNTIPSVTATGGFSIPIGTPFQLVASGTDANGDALTYCWEEADLGGSTTVAAADNGTSPINRSRNPTTSNTRLVPPLANILAGSTTTQDKMPAVARATYAWRCYVRDNRAGGGGVSGVNISLAVVATAGPFSITSQNTATTWPVGSTQTVTWNVNSTTAAPINAATVNILLSTDGGNTFPITLASATPNDGSQAITVPANVTSTGRIKIIPTNNIFFDINNASITISGTCTGASIASNPSPLTRCVGTSAAFSVTAAGTAPFTYQWRKNTVNIGGATSSTYTIASVVAGDVGSYDCVVTNGCGNATSTAAALTVNTAASVASNPSGLTRCTGTSATFSVTAAGTAPFTYQWRKTGINIGGATSSSYTIPSVAAGDAGFYDVVVTNSCGNATSTVATLTVNTSAGVSAHPASTSACEGQPASFSVTATGTAPFTYQWRKNTVNIVGATASTYNIATVAAGDAGSYDVVVTNSCGNTTSNAATLTVNTAPGISAPPSNASACEGQPASFSVFASGTAPFTYQWRKNTTNILGATSSTLSFAAVTAGDAGSYDVVVTNACGNATSTAATLSVDTGPSTSNPSNQTLAAGGIANFSVTASGSGPLSYQWRKDTVNLTDGGDISGATTNSLSIANVDLADEGSYDVVVTNLCGSATSTAATLDVTGCPTDLDDGSGTGVPDGGTDVNDLLYFLACFEVGGPCADIDDDGQDPQSPDGGTDINDLLFFLAHFEAGC